MAAGVYNTVIEQGASWRRRLTWCRKNPDGSAGAPYDLTHCSAYMQIRPGHDQAVITEISTETQEITIDGPNGIIVLYLSPAKTDLIARRARYDLLVVFPSGDAYRVLGGKINVALAITEP